MYAYGSGVALLTNAPQFFIAALMENDNGGNTTWATIITFTG